MIIATGMHYQSIQQKSVLPKCVFGKADSTEFLVNTISEPQVEIKPDLLMPEKSASKNKTEDKKQKRLSWLAKWMLGTAALGGVLSYSNQPPGPLDQVYLQSETIRHQGKKMDWQALSIENEVQILQENLAQVDRFKDLGFYPEARQFFADAAQIYQQSAKSLSDIKALSPKNKQRFSELQQAIQNLPDTDQAKVRRYLNESQWAAQTMPEYWEQDSQKHLSTMNSAMGFAYHYTLTTPPLQADTPQMVANGTRSALQALQDNALQLKDELSLAQKDYVTAEERFSYNRAHYWEAQKAYPNLPRHRPYTFGVDRYGDRVFHFERDLIKQEYKIKAFAQRLLITQKAYQMMLEKAKMDPLLKDHLPKLKAGLVDVQHLTQEAQRQATGIHLKNMLHRLQSDSVESRPMTLQVKQRAEEIREGL